MNPYHIHKTAFHTVEVLFAYQRMEQGLTSGPPTYTRLKDPAPGRTPGPDPDPPPEDAVLNCCLGSFMDDDAMGGIGLDTMFAFLHDHYFPRLAWARLSLNPEKSTFFALAIDILRHKRVPRGLRPGLDMLSAFRGWPTPENEGELMKFLDTPPWVDQFLPGRSDKIRSLKSALAKEKVPVAREGKLYYKWRPASFE